MKKLMMIMLLCFLLVGCSGERIGDVIETENETCTTTMEYKWVWSLFEDSGFRKVPVTKCDKK